MEGGGRGLEDGARWWSQVPHTGLAPPPPHLLPHPPTRPGLTHGEGHAGQGGKCGLMQRAGQEHQLDQGAQQRAEEGVLVGWVEGGQGGARG